MGTLLSSLFLNLSRITLVNAFGTKAIIPQPIHLQTPPGKPPRPTRDVPLRLRRNRKNNAHGPILRYPPAPLTRPPAPRTLSRVHGRCFPTRTRNQAWLAEGWRGRGEEGQGVASDGWEE